MFEKSLTDLIRGIRANKKDEDKYIAQALLEIRKEVKDVDPDVKAMAILKLSYLEMIGYDMSWASFNVIEAMSSPKYANKRIGYLAAANSFRQDTDVLMLTTNLIKKDFASHNHYEIGIALNGLSQMVSPNLARDLSPDLISLLNHSRPYVRKKAILALYKCFLKYPDALRIAFPRIREKLEDPDPSVVSAAVNVICELARRNPKNYLALAPQLFGLLTTSSNNWMLIKIIKLFAALTPLEPRLIKKLLPPLTSLIEATPAMSLLYECIYTAIAGGMLNENTKETQALAKTCVNKLITFLEDPDQNLKYIGLLALSKILPTYPSVVAEHQHVILECLDDKDQSIKYRALDLVQGMVNRRNLKGIVKRLMSHLVPTSGDNDEDESDDKAITSGIFSANATDPSYRADVINKIVQLCSQNSYANITDFEWYISVLVHLVYSSGINVGDLLKQQLMDIAVRVQVVRSFCVRKMVKLLSDKNLLENADQSDSNSSVLYAAAWISGEYCQYLESSMDTIEYLLFPQVKLLPVDVQAVYVHAIAKIFAQFSADLIPNWNNTIREQLVGVIDIIMEKMDVYLLSADSEVQERASNLREIFIGLRPLVAQPTDFSDLVSFDDSSSDNNVEYQNPVLQYISDFASLFQRAGELNPVAAKAQRKVPVPSELDLDARIHDLPAEYTAISFTFEEQSGEESAGAYDDPDAFYDHKPTIKSKSKKTKDSESDAAIRELRRKERLERLKDDPYYILDAAGATSTRNASSTLMEDDIDSIPIVKLDLGENAISLMDTKKKKSKKDKKTKRRTITPPSIVITIEGEMPDNAVDSGGEEWAKSNGSKAEVAKRKNVLKLDDALDSLSLEEDNASQQSTSVPVTTEKSIADGSGKEKIIINAMEPTEKVKKKSKKKRSTRSR